MADIARRTLLTFTVLTPLAARTKPPRPKAIASAGFGLAAFGTAPFGQ